VGLERGPLSLVSTTDELLDRKVAPPVQKSENMAVGIRYADHAAPSIRKKLAVTSPTSGGRSVGRYSSPADSDHGVLFFLTSALLNLLSDSPCERIGKWDTCQLEYCKKDCHIIRCMESDSF
jgi:hypothetical protein